MRVKGELQIASRALGLRKEQRCANTAIQQIGTISYTHKVENAPSGSKHMVIPSSDSGHRPIASSSGSSNTHPGLGRSNAPSGSEGFSLNQSSESNTVAMAPKILGSLARNDRTNYEVTYHIDIADILQYQNKLIETFSQVTDEKCPVCWLMEKPDWDSHKSPCTFSGLSIVGACGALRSQNFPKGCCYSCGMSQVRVNRLGKSQPLTTIPSTINRMSLLSPQIVNLVTR